MRFSIKINQNKKKMEWQDIMGSGTVLRRVLKEGVGDKPEYKQEVRLIILLIDCFVEMKIK